ncbi:lactadherin-like isoform X3 [Anneissia japonica]|uniref:lactadherin-like isoform X3 n=1 Tax=Anneissia japonica TaxID=1529436 RepID=UPI001425AC39|nr:lactadherin-like isoform X3 [Anneissia japonica]
MLKRGTCRNFVGNSDHDTMVTNILSDPVYAQFVRVHPTDWYSHISLRFEVLGCSADKMAEHSTYYKSLNFHRSITTQNSTGSCIRCAVKCMRAPECKYFKCDGGCHLYTCSKEDNVVAFQFGSYIPFN